LLSSKSNITWKIYIYIMIFIDDQEALHSTQDITYNGVAERTNRTILEKTSCLKLNVRLAKNFKADAMNITCFLINKLPRAALYGKLTEKVWTCNLVNYFGLKVFGCLAYMHVSNDVRLKLNAKSRYVSFYGIRKSTTRKSDNTNGITDGNFLSVKIADENNSVSNSVGISRWKNSVGDAAGVKFFLKIATAGWRGFYSDEFTDGNTEGFKPGQPSRDVSLPRTKSTTDLQMEYSVGESVGKRQYILPLPTLSLPLYLLLLPLLLPHPTSPLPNCSQPPISTLPSSQHKLALKFLILLYVVTTSVNSCGFYHFL